MMKRLYVFCNAVWAVSGQPSWPDTAMHSDSIKDSISSGMTFVYFKPKLETVIQVDALQAGLGGVLFQNGKPIAC